MVRVDGKCCFEFRCIFVNGQVVDFIKVQILFFIVFFFSGGYVNFRFDINYVVMGSGGYFNMFGSRNGMIFYQLF